MPAAGDPVPLDHPPDRIRTVTIEALLEGAGELVILHKGAQYRLRITRQDKLILTK